MGRPEQIRKYYELDLRGVGPRDRVPFDAMTWYRLVPIDSTGSPRAR
ncbi:MAG: hypothetical protein AB7R55_04895 [Gemmatimonadales bacterium]